MKQSKARTHADSFDGGDGHKTWDIYPPRDMDPVAYVLTLKDRDETYQEGAKRMLSLPSARGMPKDIERGLKRVAAGLPPPERVAKHLPGLHDQSSHGNRYGGPDMSSLFKVSASKMHTSFRSAFAEDSPLHNLRGFVSFYSRKDYRGMENFVKYGGKVGGSIKTHPDGKREAVAVFNNGGPRGAALDLIRDLITDHGVNYLECFGDTLRQKYESMGFQVTDTYPFDGDELDGYWDFESHNHPNYYTFDYTGVKKLAKTEGEQIAEEVESREQARIDQMSEGKEKRQAQALLDASKAFT